MTFHKRTEVNKTRKEHECLGCLQMITTGSQAIKHQGQNEEEIYSYYLHIECHEFLVKHNEFLEEGVWDGCVNEIKSEIKIGQA